MQNPALSATCDHGFFADTRRQLFLAENTEQAYNASYKNHQELKVCRFCFVSMFIRIGTGKKQFLSLLDVLMP